MNSPLSKSRRGWVCLRGPAPELTAVEMLHINGHLGSAIKLVAPLGGEPGLWAEIPPLDPDDPWVVLAEAERNSFSPADYPQGAAAMDHLAVDAVDRIFAAAGEIGFAPDIRPGGDTSIPLGAGWEARPRSLGGHPGLCVAAGVLPEEEPCRGAVCAHALAATAELKLVRASLADGGLMVWEVPLADELPADLVGHALNALATAARCAARESEDLATNPDLASEWMRFHKSNMNRNY